MAEVIGRRERAKAAKLSRIMAAATELFAKHGVDEVTTSQLAEAADIGTGTLFLYVKTKGELLLLVQNANYQDALRAGLAASAGIADPVEAIMALLVPVIECNRKHVENGRIYLREMIFGDESEGHDAALEIAGRTEQAVADILRLRAVRSDEDAAALAGVVSSILLLALSSPALLTASNDEIAAAVEAQLSAVLR